MQFLVERVKKAFELTYELAVSLDEAALDMKIKEVPSNTIGQQFWCMIGARQSYLKAMQSGKWQGFSCSLKNTRNRAQVLHAMEVSQAEMIQFLEGQTLTPDQVQLLIVLLEHEVLHHGQLIRYIYGNHLSFPKGWHERYTV